MKDNWNVVTIESVCDILDNMRIPLNSEQREMIPGNIPYYGANGVQGHIGKFIFDEELVLLAEDGGNFEDYSTRPIAYKVSGKSWVNNHAHILRAKNGLNQDYLFYSVVNKNILPFIKGGTRSKLNLSDLKCVEIDLPPLPQQRKIAEILTTCDAVIEKTEAAIAKYQAMKQGLMHDLFTRGIDVTTGKLRPKYEDAKHLYKESELGWIPKEWEAQKLETIIDAIDPQPDHRTPESVENGIPYLGINDIDSLGNINYFKCRKVSLNILEEHNKRYKIRNGDIIFGKIGTIGQPKRLSNFKDLTLSANVILIQPKSESDYVYWILNTGIVNEYINNSVHTTSQPAFGMEKIRKLCIPICDSSEQLMISERLNKLENKIKTEQSALSKYQQLKKGLMQDLLSGKVEVKV